MAAVCRSPVAGWAASLKGGGGLAMILVLAAVFILPKLLGGGVGVPPGPTVAPASEASPSSNGATATCCSSSSSRSSAVRPTTSPTTGSTQLPLSFGVDYQDTQTVFFSGSTNTGCGQASSQTGPFYCPLDKLVYFDLDFLVQLQEQFGATGDLAAQYIVAHEYGHHVQNVLGINARDAAGTAGATRQRANQYSVALELQADCFAGAWARDASDRNLFDQPERDRGGAQRRGGRRRRPHPAADARVASTPRRWTHGSSAQRVRVVPARVPDRRPAALHHLQRAALTSHDRAVNRR